MAKTWSLNEDIIVCKYCMENRGAYGNKEHIRNIAINLEEYGYEERSMRSIEHRAYAFDILIENRQLPYVSNQVIAVFKELNEMVVGK